MRATIIGFCAVAAMAAASTQGVAAGGGRQSVRPFDHDCRYSTFESPWIRGVVAVCDPDARGSRRIDVMLQSETDGDVQICDSSGDHLYCSRPDPSVTPTDFAFPPGCHRYSFAFSKEVIHFEPGVVWLFSSPWQVHIPVMKELTRKPDMRVEAAVRHACFAGRSRR